MTAEVTEIDVADLGPLVRIAGGGQGFVHGLRDDPDGPVYKEYLPRVVDDLDVDALRAFVRFAEGLDADGRVELLSRVAWPEAVVRRDGVVRGFLMRRVPAEYRTELRFAGDADQELALTQFLLNPPEYLAAVGLRVTDRFRLEFLADTAEALAVLHGMGIAVGDLSPNNLLFSLTDHPRCFFVDSDSMRLGEHAVLPPVETPDWRVGDLGDEELGTPASDVYKFGLLAVRLFAADQSTTDPAGVPRRLRQHVRRCLAADPGKRPRAHDLLPPLRQALRRLPERDEEPEPAPIPTPRPAPPERDRPRAFWVPIVIGVAVVLGIVFGTFDDSDGTAGTTTLPTNTFRAPPSDWMSAFPLPTPDLDPLPPYYPTYLPPITLPSCPVGVDGAVAGGDGLAAARTAIGELCASSAGGRWSEHGPYESAEIVGFFGEGDDRPSATVDLTGSDGGCWRTSVQFGRNYAVLFAGPLSGCG